MCTRDQNAAKPLTKRYRKSNKMPYTKKNEDMIILREKEYSSAEKITLGKREIQKFRQGGFPKFYCDFVEKINPLLEKLYESLLADNLRVDLPYAIVNIEEETWEDYLGKSRYALLFSPDLLWSDNSAREFYTHGRRYEICSPKVVLHNYLEDLLYDLGPDMSNKSINQLKKVIKKLQEIQI